MFQVSASSFYFPSYRLKFQVQGSRVYVPAPGTRFYTLDSRFRGCKNPGLRFN